MKPIFRTLCLFAVVVVGFACSTPSSRNIPSDPIVAGMTAAQLEERFGPPLRIQKNSDGSSDWFYNFSSELSKGPARAVGAGYGGKSSLAVMSEDVVHLSAAGEVIPPIPEGSVVKP